MKLPVPAIDVAAVLAADYARLRARRRALEQGPAPADDPRWVELAAAVLASHAAVQRRAARVPEVRIDESLPIAAEAARITEMIGQHQVLVVAGETGSGKTTQLPKLCLAAGRGTHGLIGCTQPRRIAARSVASRVAQELGTELGGLVGYQVRFTDQVGPESLIKFMTDGILLAETQGDAWLNAYDTLIIDEAHERSLNIDFLLGYLKRLLVKRRDLKLIVTSATIDTERFAAHFGGAPVVTVEGRSFPVEVRWREEETVSESLSEAPLRRDRGRSESDSDTVSFDTVSRQRRGDPLVEAIDEISASDPLGDVLVFLPGEREIRDAHLALSRRKYRATEVLPLYARLSARDQDRVFNPGAGRRIVLATNVAETSLTVPRIRYVVDPGTARVNRFSHRNKVQRLHIEPISQASADQRKGRCGRVGPGICYRLYGEEDFNARPRYTEPELLRSSLAGVILRLLSLKLGAIETFPFLDPPGDRAIADGYQQLQELDAITPDRRALTEVGRTLARLPIDVKLGRMLVEAQRLDCLRELTVIAAFLSIQDPRERPAEAREAADRAHALFADKASDFVAVLNFWDAYRNAHEELTQSKLRDWCETHFCSFLRMREWRELHRQLLLLCQELHWRANAEPAAYEPVHRALLSGFAGHVGRRDEKGQYQGTRGRKFTPFPGSGLAKSQPLWMLSAVYLDTARLYALMNARVEPEWIEQQAPHLVKKRHFDPHWSRRDGKVLGYEQVTLFGLSLVERRRVDYARVDPAEARRVFIRDALATGEIDARAELLRENRRVLEAARAEEEKLRRRGLVREPEELAAWWEPRIPADVASSASLDAWVKSLSPEARRAMVWSLADVMASDASPANAFPSRLSLGGRDLKLSYRFDPNHPSDGVTLEVPLELLNAVPPARLEWLVPGLLPDKVAELIRGLPKSLRRNFVPAPDFARAFCAAEAAGERVLLPTLGAYLARVTDVPVPIEEWDLASLPAHLRMNVRLLDESRQLLAESRDLSALRAEYGGRARQEFARTTAASLAREGLLRFDLESLPESVKTDTGLAAFPALVDQDTSVAIRVFETAEEAAAMHGAGVARLLRLTLADKLRQGRKQLPLSPRVAIAYTAIASPDRLREDVIDAAFDDLVRERVGEVRTRVAFEALAAEISRTVFAKAVARVDQVEATLQAYAALVPKLKPELMGFARANYDDLRAQLKGLVYPGFARDFPESRLTELPRYLKAMTLRVERLQQDPRKDQARMLEVLPFVETWRKHADRGDVSPSALERLRWLIEEYRVQLFAQELKTREAVSDKRLRKVVEELNPS